MAAWDRNTPWRQGFLLDEVACREIFAQEPLAQDSVVIVVSHDCDLAQDVQYEPMLEIIVGQKVAKLDGNCANAKNARKLHLTFDGTEGHAGFCAEFVANQKQSIAKQQLAPYSPLATHQLSLANHTTLQKWLASRYRRSAFPEEFERRLKHEGKVAEKIDKIMKPLAASILAVLFDVDGGEEVARTEADDPYVLRIFIMYAADAVLPAGHPDAGKNAKNAAQAVERIEEVFEKAMLHDEQWRYIELQDCRAISEEVMTYARLKQLKQWRVEHMSLAADPQQELIVE
ncbi:MAG: hypothetical protein HYZ45_14265 [Burkholderiales bacterium]|nr:hypothetical protein [Burkholderiales bacterium]